MILGEKGASDETIILSKVRVLDKSKPPPTRPIAHSLPASMIEFQSLSRESSSKFAVPFSTIHNRLARLAPHSLLLAADFCHTRFIDHLLVFEDHARSKKVRMLQVPARSRRILIPINIARVTSPWKIEPLGRT